MFWTYEKGEKSVGEIFMYDQKFNQVNLKIYMKKLFLIVEILFLKELKKNDYERKNFFQKWKIMENICENKKKQFFSIKNITKCTLYCCGRQIVMFALEVASVMYFIICADGMEKNPYGEYFSFENCTWFN